MNAIAKLAAADRRKMKERAWEGEEGKGEGEEEGGKGLEEGKEAGAAGKQRGRKSKGKGTAAHVAVAEGKANISSFFGEKKAMEASALSGSENN